MTRWASLFSLFVFCGCASQYTLPSQTFHGYLGVAPTTQPLPLLTSLPTEKLRMLVVHPGLDQIPSYRHHSIQMDLADGLQILKEELARTKRFSRIDMTGLTHLDPKSIEDLRRMAVLFDCQWVMVVGVYYDVMSFYSGVGQFVGWVPYINFVSPMYKMGGAMRVESVVIDASSSRLLWMESAQTRVRERSSSWFVKEHFLSLSRKMHLETFRHLTTKVKAWLRVSKT